VRDKKEGGRCECEENIERGKRERGGKRPAQPPALHCCFIEIEQIFMSLFLHYAFIFNMPRQGERYTISSRILSYFLQPHYVIIIYFLAVKAILSIFT